MQPELDKGALEKATLALLRHDENTAPHVDWWAERRMRFGDWKEGVSYAIEGYREAQTVGSIEQMDALDLRDISEDQVVEAFRQSLRSQARYMELDGETDLCRETPEQAEERTDHLLILNTLQLNYVSNHVK